MMTAPLKASEITVPVALGDRAYDIAIGRGLMAELGKRIAALKPGARTVIVTDETVAMHHLKAAEAWPRTSPKRHASIACRPIRATPSHSPILAPPMRRAGGFRKAMKRPQSGIVEAPIKGMPRGRLTSVLCMPRVEVSHVTTCKRTNGSSLPWRSLLKATRHHTTNSRLIVTFSPHG